MSKILLTIKNLKKSYSHIDGSITLFDNFNLQIKEGELVALVGPSGSGKSSLLHIMALLDDPSKGEIKIDKIETKNLSDVQKDKLRRDFIIKKDQKVLIVEDVITTGKSSLECVKLIKKSKAKLVGFASIIDRSTKKSLKIKNKIVSHLKIDVPSYNLKNIPKSLKSIPITTPGSRFIK